MKFTDLLIKLKNIESSIRTKADEEQVNEALGQMIYYDVVSRNNTKSEKDLSNNK